jgi:8-oxo-dGTP diphosphatase
MAVHLVRHADAGKRDRWHGPDEERPLTEAGRARAAALVQELSPVAPTRILSSPLVRCVETVQPLADALGLVVELHPALAEGASPDETWSLLERLVGGRQVVLCSHGDVIPPLLERLQRRGVPIQGGGRDVAKGSVWSIEAGSDGRLANARLESAP